MDAEMLDITPVKLIDRAGLERFERTFDGRPWIKAAGKVEWMLPRYVAEWLFKRDRDMVWTASGDYVHRFALAEDTDSELVDQLTGLLGAEILDHDPIVINHDAQEGWDTRQVDRPNGVEVRKISGAALREAEQATRARQPAAPVVALKG